MGDRGEAQYVDVQNLAGAPCRLEILPGVVAQPKVQSLPDRGLPHNVRVAFELVPDGRPDEVAAVRVEALLYHQIEVPSSTRLRSTTSSPFLQTEIYMQDVVPTVQRLTAFTRFSGRI